MTALDDLLGQLPEPDGYREIPNSAELADPLAKRIRARAQTDRDAEAVAADTRVVRLTPASAFTVRPVRWLWDGRLPLGALCLLAGREGLGKSTLGYQLGADISCGRLPGVFYRQPKSVLVAASEDSWEHTIVPRLMAAGADLDRIFRVDTLTDDGLTGELVLPADIDGLVCQARDVDAAMLLLDPLLSRLSSGLDTHKDAEVRRALEPLKAATEQADLCTFGLIHVSKSTSSDPLSLIMASRAFPAVARAVLFVMADPDQEGVRLLGQPKNNLGRSDLPTLTFEIESAHVADTAEGPVFTGRLNWTGESERTLASALEDVAGGAGHSAVDDAVAWLEDYLTQHGGGAESGPLKTAASKAGHKDRTLKRATVVAKIRIEAAGWPRKTYWLLPGAALDPPTTEPTP